MALYKVELVKALTKAFFILQTKKRRDFQSEKELT